MGKTHLGRTTTRRILRPRTTQLEPPEESLCPECWREDAGPFADEVDPPDDLVHELCDRHAQEYDALVEEARMDAERDSTLGADRW